MAAGKQRRVPGSIDPQVSWVKHEHLVRHCPAWAEGLPRIYLDKDEPFKKKHPIVFLRFPTQKALPGLLRDGAVDVARDLCHPPQASRHCWRPCTEPGCGHPLRGTMAARRRTAGSAGSFWAPFGNPQPQTAPHCVLWAPFGLSGSSAHEGTRPRHTGDVPPWPSELSHGRVTLTEGC